MIALAGNIFGEVNSGGFEWRLLNLPDPSLAVMDVIETSPARIGVVQVVADQALGSRAGIHSRLLKIAKMTRWVID